MMPYKAQVSNASRLGATRIAVPFERNRRVYVTWAGMSLITVTRSDVKLVGQVDFSHL